MRACWYPRTTWTQLLGGGIYLRWVVQWLRHNLNRGPAPTVRDATCITSPLIAVIHVLGMSKSTVHVYLSSVTLPDIIHILVATVTQDPRPKTRDPNHAELEHTSLPRNPVAVIVQVVGSTLTIPVSAESKVYLLWFIPGCAHKASSIYSAYRLLLDVFPPSITLFCF